MRSGACAVQQTLTAEAASVLKHSLSLARRRGHAQVTPLHVATTLLGSRASSLRRACLKSQPHQTSHPLQCRALELCFNVALNRLPTTPGPLLHGQPSLSNALIAALKRAQAHQRRGCIEQQQQQPLLTIKVELEQLIISILDDPSVSRVMREAGFSSTAVKNNLEDSSASSVFQCYNTSGGVFSSPCSPSPAETQREIINPSNLWQNHFLTYNSDHTQVLFSTPKRVTLNPITDSSSASLKEDIKLVLDILRRKKRKNTVIVGDSVSATEGLVSELMGKFGRGEVPEELKSTHFVKFQFAPVSLRFMKREEVEMSLSELKRKVDSLASGGGGAIIYTGDLKWTVEATLSEKEGGGGPSEHVSSYNPVDHLVVEMARLLSDYGRSNAKVLLMGTASYQTYMRCQMRQPPLELQWSLQAVPVPSGGLGLSLHASSAHDAKIGTSQNATQIRKEVQEALSCCEECASNYEREAQLFKPGQQKLLPSWLQAHCTETRQKEELAQLRTKWNRLCHCLHRGKQSQNHLKSTLYSTQSSIGNKGYSYTSSHPWWQTNQHSIFPDSSSISFSSDSGFKPGRISSTHVPIFQRQKSCTIEFEVCRGTTEKQQQTSTQQPSLDGLKTMEAKDAKITLALGNSMFIGSGQTMEKRTEKTVQRAHTRKLLQENLPWHSETIPSVAEALVESKSEKQNSWFIVEGNDYIGKRRLARAIAEAEFGSADLLIQCNMRKKETSSTSCPEMLARAMKTHEKLVVLVEDIDLADARLLKFLSEGFERGKFEEQGRAIFILTKDDGTLSYEEKNQEWVIKLTLQVNETKPNLEIPFFDQKRKAGWDLSAKNNKYQRIEGKQETLLFSEHARVKKDFSRQSSFNTLDLNIRADEDEASEEKPEENSPISSDLTRETAGDPLNPNGFLESIENRFDFNRSPARDREIREYMVSKIKGCYEDLFGKQNLGSFSVEEKVIEELSIGSGSFVHSLFEKWLKQVFQTSFNQTVNLGGKEGIVFRLCFGGKGDSKMESGFKGSCLPNNIQVTFMD